MPGIAERLSRQEVAEQVVASALDGGFSELDAYHDVVDHPGVYVGHQFRYRETGYVAHIVLSRLEDEPLERWQSAADAITKTFAHHGHDVEYDGAMINDQVARMRIAVLEDSNS